MKLFSFYTIISALVIFFIGLFFFGAGETYMEIILRSLFMGCIVGGLLYFTDKKRSTKVHGEK